MVGSKEVVGGMKARIIGCKQGTRSTLFQRIQFSTSSDDCTATIGSSHVELSELLSKPTHLKLKTKPQKGNVSSHLRVEERTMVYF